MDNFLLETLKKTNPYRLQLVLLEKEKSVIAALYCLEGEIFTSLFRTKEKNLLLIRLQWWLDAIEYLEPYHNAPHPILEILKNYIKPHKKQLVAELNLFLDTVEKYSSLNFEKLAKLSGYFTYLHSLLAHHNLNKEMTELIFFIGKDWANVYLHSFESHLSNDEKNNYMNRQKDYINLLKNTSFLTRKNMIVFLPLIQTMYLLNNFYNPQPNFKLYMKLFLSVILKKFVF